MVEEFISIWPGSSLLLLPLTLYSPAILWSTMGPPISVFVIMSRSECRLAPSPEPSPSLPFLISSLRSHFLSDAFPDYTSKQPSCGAALAPWDSVSCSYYITCQWATSLPSQTTSLYNCFSVPCLAPLLFVSSNFPMTGCFSLALALEGRNH